MPVAIGKQIHQSAVIGDLLGRVVVILIGRGGLRSIQAERRGRARAIGRIAIVALLLRIRRTEAVDAGVFG